MAFDPLRDRVVLFGGKNDNGPNGTVLGDTWEWDGFNWQQVTPVSSVPPRAFHGMAFDPVRMTVVLLGTQGDFWEYNGVAWTPIFCPNYPSPGPVLLAYDDVRQTLVQFGGQTHQETWEFDGLTWQQRASAAMPSARTGAAIAYDPTRQRVVLFGGTDPTFLHDTWEWDGANWFSVGPTNPYPDARYGHAMVFDAVAQHVLMMGGRNSSYYMTPMSLPSQWDGSDWSGGPSIAGLERSDFAMAYEASRGRVLVFGGSGHPVLSPLLGDTWVNRTVTAVAGPYGSGCGTPTLTFSPDPSGRPILGHNATATIANAPTPVGAVAMGWSDQFAGPFQLPVTLYGLGMPGCSLFTSAEVLGVPVSQVSPNSLQLSIFVPNQPSLLGGHAYLQAYVVAPNENPAWLVVSNAIHWMFGDV